MTTAAEWEDLARRAREAEHPDRKIDFALLKLTFPSPEMWGSQFLAYTASIDAIVALIEKTLPGWTFGVHTHPNYAEAGLSSAYVETLSKHPRACAKSPALALVAAYCEARASTKEGE